MYVGMIETRSLKILLKSFHENYSDLFKKTTRYNKSCFPHKSFEKSHHRSHFLELNQASSGCGGSTFPLSYRGLTQSRLIKAVLIPHGLGKKCLFLIKKKESFLGIKECFWRKKGTILQNAFIWKKNLDTLWTDPELVKIWSRALGIEREQLTSEVEVITDCNLSFICPYALLNEKCFYSLKNEYSFHWKIFLLKKQEAFFQVYFIEKNVMRSWVCLNPGHLHGRQVLYLWAISNSFLLMVYIWKNNCVYTSSHDSSSSFSLPRKCCFFCFFFHFAAYKETCFWDLLNLTLI